MFWQLTGISNFPLWCTWLILLFSYNIFWLQFLLPPTPPVILIFLGRRVFAPSSWGRVFLIVDGKFRALFYCSLMKIFNSLTIYGFLWKICHSSLQYFSRKMIVFLWVVSKCFLVWEVLLFVCCFYWLINKETALGQ